MNAGYRKERVDRGIKVRSDGVFILASTRDLLYVVLPVVLPIIALLIFPLLGNYVGIYWQKVLVSTMVISLLALSWNLLANVGFISLGQALFFGMGGYIAGYLNYQFGLTPMYTIPVATVAGALLSTVMFYPILRLRGIYFGLISFALPLLIMKVIEATHIFKGTEGLSGLSSIPNLTFKLYALIAVLFFTAFVYHRMISTDYGLVFNAIRDNDRSVIAAGFNVQWYKAQAVFIAALPASFAGAFMTHHTMFVGIPAFALDYSILPLTCAVIGGPGNFLGAILGAFILIPLSELLREFASLRVVIYSLILLVFVIGMPEGIYSFILRKYNQFERLVPLEDEKNEQ